MKTEKEIFAEMVAETLDSLKAARLSLTDLGEEVTTESPVFMFLRQLDGLKSALMMEMTTRYIASKPLVSAHILMRQIAEYHKERLETAAYLAQFPTPEVVRTVHLWQEIIALGGRRTGKFRQVAAITVRGEADTRRVLDIAFEKANLPDTDWRDDPDASWYTNEGVKMLVEDAWSASVRDIMTVDGDAYEITVGFRLMHEEEAKNAGVL